MSLSGAFNSLLFLHSRTVTIERPGKITPAVSIEISPSNYFRNLAGPSDVVIEGREFVISKKVLQNASYPAPKRGDRINDPDTGLMMVSEVQEMYDLGGAIIGYRIRTS